MEMGISGNQFKNAGAIGPMFADLVESVENGHLHDENPVKHKLEYINDEIDLGTFSRLRKPLDTAANVFG
jgi:sarcosine oxidase subunit beta